jgi:D-beta-D-heptose 7-phosphate kinase/D-beta-D-heptose 1-phosphate adenosyltransferase
MKRIFVNGVFDLLHWGHLTLLQQARAMGDHLHVAIDTDRRVRELKGADRPIRGQVERQALLEQLRCVDQVSVFDTEQDLRDVIQEYAPDIMVKGSDYHHRPIIGSEHCGSIRFVNIIDGYSTTATIARIAAGR